MATSPPAVLAPEVLATVATLSERADELIARLERNLALGRRTDLDEAAVDSTNSIIRSLMAGETVLT